MRELAYKRWYKTARWQRLRARHLHKSPLCVMCGADGRTTAAAACDHANRHQGDEALFWAGPFQSLCAPCHNVTKQSFEKGGSKRAVAKSVGRDGLPLDPAHPWNSAARIPRPNVRGGPAPRPAPSSICAECNF